MQKKKPTKQEQHRVSPVIDELSRKFANEAKRAYPDGEIYLFGSQAKGTADELSDVDLAVIVEKIPQGKGFADYLRASQPITDIAIELSCEYDVPVEPHLVVKESSVSGLLPEILGTGIRIDL